MEKGGDKAQLLCDAWEDLSKKEKKSNEKLEKDKTCRAKGQVDQ